MDEPELLTPSRVTRVFKEIGLHSLYHSPADTKLLCFQRFVRLLAYGGATLILVPYLKLLGINETKIGLFMTLTLVGDILISFFLTMFADRLGRRAVVAVGALLMSGSGIAFALSGNYVVLLLAAIFGVISPSGNEIGPFRAIEESALAQLSSSEVRSDIFAWYSLTSSAGAAVGTIVFGWVVQTLQARGWTTLASYRVVFFAYAATGIFKLALVCLLSKKVEPEKKPPPPHPEEEPLLRNEVAATPEVKKSLFLPHISKETTRLTIQLCLAFALDSFASGLASMSWVMYYFYTKFNLKEGQLGTIFSIGWVISTFSVLVASSIAKRIGNVKAMAFTHMPSGISLALMTIPAHLPMAVFFLMIRACTASMDVAPRAAFLAAVIPSNERTAIFGLINVVKTTFQAIGPLITGLLAKDNLFWIAFVTAGVCKVVYDISVLLVFSSYKSKEEVLADDERRS